MLTGARASRCSKECVRTSLLLVVARRLKRAHHCALLCKMKLVTVQEEARRRVRPGEWQPAAPRGSSLLRQERGFVESGVVQIWLSPHPQELVVAPS